MPIIIGVPGPWQDHEALVHALVGAQRPPRYLMAGAVLMDIRTKRSWVVEQYEADPRLAQAFAMSGAGRVSPGLTEEIRSHATTAYLISEETSVEAARATMRVVDTLLDAGGFAVKVESAGLAHPPARWRALGRQGLTGLVDALVTLVGDEHSACSCGMHNLGLPDVAGGEGMTAQELPGMLVSFNLWQLLTAPELEDGAAFVPDLDGQRFKVKRQPYGYGADSPLNNPHGRWLLEPSQDDEALPTMDSAGGPLFMALSDEEMAEASARARSTLGRLRHWWESGEWGQALVKVLITQGEDRAHMWLEVSDGDDQGFIGRFFEVPEEFAPSYRTGQELRVPWEE